MQGLLDGLTAAGSLVLNGCMRGLGVFCDLVSAAMAYRFPLGILALVALVAGALIAFELRGHRHGHAAPEPPHRA